MKRLKPEPPPEGVTFEDTVRNLLAMPPPHPSRSRKKRVRKVAKRGIAKRR